MAQVVRTAEATPAATEPVSAATVDPAPGPAMLAAAALAAIAGLQCAALGLGLEEPGFIVMLTVLALIGVGVSVAVTRAGIAPHVMELPVALGFALFCLVAMFGTFTSAMPFLAPSGAVEDRGRSMMVLLSWFLVLRTFALTSTARALFLCVPVTAVVGLAGTMSVDSGLVTWFLVFAASVTFMAVHEGVLRVQEATGGAGARAANGRLRGQLAIAGICLLGSLGCAALLAGPMNFVGTFLMYQGGAAVGQRPRQQRPMAPINVVSERQTVEVGSGPVKLGDQVLMRVTSPEALLWRGATFDRYTGTGWMSSLVTATSVDLSPAVQPALPRGRYGMPMTMLAGRLPRTLLNETGGPTHRVRQTFVLEGIGSFGSLYGASEVRALRVSDVTGSLRLEVDEAGRLVTNRSIYSNVFEADSEVIATGHDALIAERGEVPDRIARLYLGLDQMSPAARLRVTDEAQGAIRGRRTKIDRVNALAALIARSCKYNTDAPATPVGADAVENFLFQSHQGYCDLFATSLAVLCRTVGIPARVASGFGTGEPSAGGTQFIVRDRDKHMWTEVYFAGIGWAPFDVTSLVEDISPSRSQGTAASGAGLWASVLKRGWLPPLAFVAFLLMLAYVIKIEVLDRRRTAVIGAVGAELPAENMAIVSAYVAACAALGRVGLGRAPAETPGEHRGRLAPELIGAPELAAALGTLEGLFVRFRYSSELADRADASAARAALAVVHHGLRALRSSRRRQAAGVRGGSNVEADRRR